MSIPRVDKAVQWNCENAQAAKAMDRLLVSKLMEIANRNVR